MRATTQERRLRVKSPNETPGLRCNSYCSGKYKGVNDQLNKIVQLNSKVKTLSPVAALGSCIGSFSPFHAGCIAGAGVFY